MTDAHHVTEQALEAYVHGGLDPAARARVEAAVARDSELARHLDELRREHDDMQALLGAAGDAATEGAGVSDEQLALYLDGALPPGANEAVEHGLAGNAAARRRLIGIYRDRQIALGAAPMPEPQHAPAEPGPVEDLDEARAEARKRRRTVVRNDHDEDEEPREAEPGRS